MSPTKIAVVTGANKGIGFAIAKQLLQQFDGTVYVTSRDETRGKEAVAELEKLGLKPAYHQLDIDSLDSIKKFRQYLETTHGGIDVLSSESFAEQAENQIRVNFFGTLNMCKELFPLLRKHARVVHVSSGAGHLTMINGQEPEATELRNKFSSFDATEEQICELAKNFVKLAQEGTHKEAGWPSAEYATYIVSKVTLSALVPIQQRHFDKTRPEDDIAVNSVHPGYVDTDMTKHKGVLTIDEGAVAPVYLALLPPNIESPRGLFIWRDKSIVDWVNGPLPALY